MSSLRLYVYFLITLFLPESRGFGIKRALLRWAGAKVGSNVRIYSSVRILGNGILVIGDDVHIGPGTLLYSSAPATITIGNHIDIGPHVVLVTGTHQTDWNGLHVAGVGLSKDISVGDGAWLCARSVICAGVAVPPKTLVAAGAVVVRGIPESGKLVVGVPATIKTTIQDNVEV